MKDNTSSAVKLISKRVHRSSILAFCINIAFVIYNTVFAFLTEYSWYGTLAGYYFVLTVIRIGIVLGGTRAKLRAGDDDCLLEEYRIKNYLYIGIALLFLEIVMSCAITLMVLSQKPTQYGMIMAIAYAVYACYKVAMAIINIKRTRKGRAYEERALSNISLVDALVTIVSLQSAMLITFSNGDNTLLPLSAVIGALTCLATLYISIAMIVRASKWLKQTKSNIQNEKDNDNG